jgi:hypothetical protein
MRRFFNTEVKRHLNLSMMDRLLTFEDWIETYWRLQDEDLEFLTQETLRERFFNDPKGLLKELRERTQRRKEAFQFFKHLNIRDIPEDKIEEVQKKLDLLALRENLLNDLIGKILELFEIAYLGKEETEKLIKRSISEPSDIKVNKEYVH